MAPRLDRAKLTFQFAADPSIPSVSAFGASPPPNLHEPLPNEPTPSKPRIGRTRIPFRTADAWPTFSHFSRLNRNYIRTIDPPCVYVCESEPYNRTSWPNSPPIFPRELRVGSARAERFPLSCVSIPLNTVRDGVNRVRSSPNWKSVRDAMPVGHGFAVV